ncbi:TetR family transcriptional regulator [Streptomyces sp. NPDC004838]
MREALAEAAFQLFLERGYEQTTVDDIVARAGVGRRSFFRYFPSKEDAVFPDHESCLAEMTEFLAAKRRGDGGDPAGSGHGPGPGSGTGTSGAGVDPVDEVCDAARIVMRMYTAKPDFSVQRYRLTREVPGLRTYELSVVRRYERTFAGHLRARRPDAPDGALRAEMIASAVVAAHNNALRSWLRSGGEGNIEAEVEHALGLVREVWGDPAPDPAETGADRTGPAAEDDEVIIMVARKGTPVWRVVQGIESVLDESGG